MFRFRIALLAAALFVASHVPPAVADDARAAEYFALAQAAETRSDWMVAIKNYELAYKESSHPDILFNIALNYERLKRNRDAARFLTRFAKETKEPSERAKANAKLKELKEMPGKVNFTSKPAGATIVVDGDEIGVTPLERELAPGDHNVVAVFNGSKSLPRKVAVEFGEPISIDFRIGAKPGRLTVRANVKEAEVIIDGVSRGRAPFSNMLPAGRHTVLVAAPGYKTVSRDIEVPSEGSEQITAQLTPIAGVGKGTGTTLAPIGYLIGFGFGLSSEADADASARGLVEGGIRTRTQLWDFVGTYGSYGGNVGFGFGAAARVYFGGRTFRPYARAALAYGRVDDFAGDKTGSLAAEGGLGVRYVGKPTGRTGFSIEYFAEVNFQIASAKTGDMPPDEPTPLLTPTGAVSLSFPLTLGIAMRFGRRR